MKWFLGLCLILLPASLMAEEKATVTCEHVNDGSKCFSVDEYAEWEKTQETCLENAEELAQVSNNLQLCRKWRDKYKARLSKDQILNLDKTEIQMVETRYETKWSQNTWVKVGIATALAFGLGVGIGVAF